MHRKVVLPGGLRLVTEEVPHVRSVSIGVWVGSGSRHETELTQGVSHFIEHMLFKGTDRRTAKQLADAVEVRGGQFNAFTTKEHTCIHVKVLDEDFTTAVDVLSDMILNSRFDAADIEKEKGVVIEEINACRDVPDDFIHDLAMRAAWPGHVLGRDILGTPESIGSFTRETVVSEFRSRYVKRNALVVVAGNVPHDVAADAVARAFDPMAPGEFIFEGSVPEFVPGRLFERRETEQAHVCAVTPGTSASEDDYYALSLLCSILGGASGSRLFQKIREERGLAYSVYSYQSAFADAGLMTVYLGASPRHAAEALEAVLAEYDEVRNRGVTADELDAAKAQARGSLLLGLESTSARMLRLGKSEMTIGRPMTVDEMLSKVEAVSMREIGAVASLALDSSRAAVACVGPEPVMSLRGSGPGAGHGEGRHGQT